MASSAGCTLVSGASASTIGLSVRSIMSALFVHMEGDRSTQQSRNKQQNRWRSFRSVSGGASLWDGRIG
jgi:hypothetical protein